MQTVVSVPAKIDNQTVPSNSTTLFQAGELRNAAFESIRALSILWVLIFHVFGEQQGYQLSAMNDTLWHRLLMSGSAGVYVFFGLSGYLLFWPFVCQYLDKGKAVDLTRYALNRVVRILPLYWFAVTVLLLKQPGHGTFDQWWRFLTFSENFSKATVLTVDGPMWSLVVELHFYILLPLLSYAILKVADKAKHPLFVAALGLLLMGAASHHIWYQDPLRESTTGLLRVSLICNFWHFVPGMLVALIRRGFETQDAASALGPPAWCLQRGPLRAPAISRYSWKTIFTRIFTNGPLLFYTSIMAIAAHVVYPTPVTVISLATFLLISSCALPTANGKAAPQFLTWRPLTLIGMWSYSLYLWHYPVLNWLRLHGMSHHGFLANFAATLLLGLIVSFFSYSLIERPFLKLRRQWSANSAVITQ